MIREYDEINTIHPSGFIGVRVAVAVDGDLRQRYYNFRNSRRDYLPEAKIKALKAEAGRIHEKWLADKAAAEAARKSAARKPRTDRSVGIDGITVGWFLDQSHRILSTGERRDYQWLRPIIQVSVQIDGIKHYKRFFLSDMPFDKAWKLALQYLRDLRGLKRVPRSWNAAKPSPAEMKKRYLAAKRKYPNAVIRTKFSDLAF